MAKHFAASTGVRTPPDTIRSTSAGSTAAAREKGQVRLEGKDYVMQDGDVTYFRFNV